MNPIADSGKIDRYLKLVDDMLISDRTYQRDFNQVWLQNHGWKVVPARSEISHLSPEEIERIVPALNRVGYIDCLAVATEPLDPLPPCYGVRISAEDLRNFNKECGLLGYMLMDDAHSWAISCYGFYKLFAGPPGMLEVLLGAPISVARKAFWDFALSLDPTDPESPFLKVASRYADPRAD